jgi:hypothetical protein
MNRLFLKYIIGSNPIKFIKELKMFIISFHSVIDQITNSSTELFMSESNLSIEIVQEILQKLLDDYNKKDGYNRKYKDVFKKPVIYTRKKYNEKAKEAERYCKQDILYNIKQAFYAKNNSERTYYKNELYKSKNCFINNKFCIENYKYILEYEYSNNIGNIIIEGVTDNSIPYDLFEEIESLLNAKWYHVG